MESKECVLCNGDAGEYGNNPWPLSDEGVCCDSCNNDVVFTRIIMNNIGRNIPQK